MQPVERRPLVPPLAAADAVVGVDLNDSVAMRSAATRSSRQKSENAKLLILLEPFSATHPED
jgi:hypothetical protein